MYIDKTGIAKIIRKRLQKEYPNYPKKHFSVRCGSGDSVNVSWTDYPTPKEIDDLLSVYEGVSFDGYTDMVEYNGFTDPETGITYSGGSYIFPSYTLSDERKELIKKYYMEKFNYTELPSDFEYQINKLNEELDENGKLRAELVKKQFSDEELLEIFNEYVMSGIKSIRPTKTGIPIQFIEKFYPSLHVTKGGYVDLSKYHSRLIEESKKLFFEKINEFKGIPRNYEEIKNITLNSTKDLLRTSPILQSIKHKYISELDELSKKIDEEFLRKNGLTCRKMLIDYIEDDSFYSSQGDYLYTNTYVNDLENEKDWESMYYIYYDELKNKYMYGKHIEDWKKKEEEYKNKGTTDINIILNTLISKELSEIDKPLKERITKIYSKDRGGSTLYNVVSQSAYFKKIKDMFILSYKQGDNYFVLLPHMFIFVFTDKSGTKSKVIYSLKSNNLQEIKRNYILFNTNIVRKLDKSDKNLISYLNEVKFVVNNLNLR